MGERSWLSPAAITSRLGTSSWLWLNEWVKIEEHAPGTVPLDRAWQTCLLTPKVVTFSVADNQLYLPLGPMKHASPAFRLIEFDSDDDPDGPRLFGIEEYALSIVHVTDCAKWLAIPTTWIGPKHMFQGFQRHAPRHRVGFLQNGTGVPIIQYRLSMVRNTLSLEDLQQLCSDLELARSDDRHTLLSNIAAYLCPINGVAREQLLQAMIEMDKRAPRNETSELTENTLEMMDPEDQEEFSAIQDTGLNI